MHESDDLEEMTSKLNEVVAQTLDECAPIRTFKVREQHKFGLSETTKQSMKERDKLRCIKDRNKQKRNKQTHKD